MLAAAKCRVVTASATPWGCAGACPAGARAAHKLFYLMSESQRRRLSGVDLKEDAPALPAADSRALPGAGNSP